MQGVIRRACVQATILAACMWALEHTLQAYSIITAELWEDEVEDNNETVRLAFFR